MLSVPTGNNYEFQQMESAASKMIKHLLEDIDITQKEIAQLLEISQPAVSKRIKKGEFTVEEIMKISLHKGVDLFSKLNALLPITIRNTNNQKDTLSPVEQAILTLVKNKLK